MPVIAVLSPRFRLMAALGERREAIRRPVALAPEPGAAQLIGEVSAAAEAIGVREGMRLGEALSRCPQLLLVPPDSERAVGLWEGALRGLEGIGAEIECERAGEAFFEGGGLRALWGGLDGVLRRTRREAGTPVRLAAAPGRFCAYAAARRARPGQPPPVVPESGARRFLAPLPVALLQGRLGPAPRGEVTAPAEPEPDAEADDLPNELERLGIQALGRLAELPRGAVADRFGRLGLRARALARGEDDPLRPRPPHRRLAVALELPEAASGPQLERAMELLIARLLAHPERRGRSIRALRLGARLAAGGGWLRRVSLRSASTDRRRLGDLLAPLLSQLPGPASVLRLEAAALGPAGGEQLSLASAAEQRHRRISEAVRQARAAGGSDSVMRVLEVDPDSRLPERRDLLIPWSEDA